MSKIKINGKKWKLRARMGAIRELRSKYAEELREMDLRAEAVKNNNYEYVQEKEDSEIETFLIELVWQFIKPKLFFIKPYLSYDKFKERIEISDLNKASTTCILLFMGTNPDNLNLLEDREAGNVNEPQENG